MGSSSLVEGRKAEKVPTLLYPLPADGDLESPSFRVRLWGLPFLLCDFPMTFKGTFRQEPFDRQGCVLCWRRGPPGSSHEWQTVLGCLAQRGSTQPTKDHLLSTPWLRHHLYWIISVHTTGRSKLTYLRGQRLLEIPEIPHLPLFTKTRRNYKLSKS